MIEETKVTNKERIHYIDVLKGILIVCVVIGHVAWAAQKAGLESTHFHLWGKVFHLLCGGWYMPCFFAVSGFCSNFNKDTKTFISNNLYTLILPALIVSGKQLAWFCVALFIAKLMFFFILRKTSNKVYIVIIAMLASILGCLFKNINPEPFNLWHALSLFPFLVLGYYLKEVKKDYFFYISGAAYIICVICCYIYGLYLPSLSAVLDVSFKYLPIHWILAGGGSVFMFWFTKSFIPKCRFIEYLGRNSLFIYLIHISVISLFWKVAAKMNVPTDSILVYVTMVISVVVSIAVSLIGCEIINSKYLCWIKGKFND